MVKLIGQLAAAFEAIPKNPGKYRCLSCLKILKPSKRLDSVAHVKKCYKTEDMEAIYEEAKKLKGMW
jgi:hypothetical protein